jgi:hypothetical protein
LQRGIEGDLYDVGKSLQTSLLKKRDFKAGTTRPPSLQRGIEGDLYDVGKSLQTSLHKGKL